MSFSSEETILKLQEENKKLREENDSLKTRMNIPSNKGEQITADHLQLVLEDLKKQGLVSKYKVYNNLSIDGIENNSPRQIDHLVITTRGVFVIETKHWKGDIYYNFSEKDLNKYNLGGLKEYLYDEETRNYKTFILDSSNYNLVFNSYGHPFKQVLTTAKTVKEKFSLDFVNPIIYFNYCGDYKLYIGKNEKYVSCASSKKELFDTIYKKMTTDNKFNRYYSDDEINEISQRVERPFKLSNND
ncbi:NERD domain-containing protein [Staphylococcus petrasii]|uniref:NERD domain-containing protein n=1 Tax=Staphylococcus petrasii TaxID=1276936 RepID=UPI001F580A38|nr:NERD domain-containing protein [Staphylococcus petrasii]MCI2773850.1 NERD domain-containing protein [Staphylococcus petrasii]